MGNRVGRVEDRRQRGPVVARVSDRASAGPVNVVVPAAILIYGDGINIGRLLGEGARSRFLFWSSEFAQERAGARRARRWYHSCRAKETP
jgi:hypothetical protein